MQIDVITSRDELATIRDEWERLPRPSVMQSPAWLLAWWNVYNRSNSQLSVVAVRDGVKLIGLAPWYTESTRSSCRLRWMGDGRACSDHATILCESEHQAQVARTIADWMVNAEADSWQQFVLDSVDDDDTMLSQLVDQLADRGCPISHQQEPGSCYVELSTTWDEYLASVSKNHRKKCRRYFKQFFATGKARVEVFNTADACAEAFDLMAKLHNDRRRAVGDEGAFTEPRFRAFHRSAIYELAARGQLQLRVLHVDDQAVAAEYLLEEGDSLFAYQGGLSAAGEAVSAGTLSMIAMIRDAIDTGHRRLDLLRGVERYKFSWGARHRPAKTVIIRRGNAIGRIGAWRASTWSSAKKLRHRLISSP
ncbi:MAG: GNAT family N-acetyltransferase [Aeoliella sp.]